MKKHSLIAIVLIALVALPLAAATRSAKKTPASQSVPPTAAAVMAAAPAQEKPSEKGSAPAKAKSKSGKAAAKTTASRESAKESAAEKVPARQARARALVADLTTAQKTKLLAFLNEASVKELAEIDGISTTRGAAIEKARPFAGIDEVALVKGIGEGTFAEIVKHGKTLTLARTAASGDTKPASARKSS